jgi:predicted membrane channel-forming protein YqfA (hemolysin III family)
LLRRLIPVAVFLGTLIALFVMLNWSKETNADRWTQVAVFLVVGVVGVFLIF